MAMSLSQRKNTIIKTPWGSCPVTFPDRVQKTYCCFSLVNGNPLFPSAWFFLGFSLQLFPLMYFGQLCCQKMKEDFIDPLRGKNTGKADTTTRVSNNGTTIPAKETVLSNLPEGFQTHHLIWAAQGCHWVCLLSLQIMKLKPGKVK